METMQTSIAMAFIVGLGLGVITALWSIIIKAYTDEKYIELKAQKEQAEEELRAKTQMLETKEQRLKQAEFLLGELKDVFKELIDELRTKNKEDIYRSVVDKPQVNVEALRDKFESR